MFKLIIPKQIEKDMKIFPKEQNILILKKIEENDILLITLIRIAHRKEVY